MILNLNLNIFPLYSYRKLQALLGIDGKYLKHIASKAGRYYKPFDTRDPGKKKWRHIDNPIDPLKSLQKKINQKILRPLMLSLPKEMVGGVQGKSVKDSAMFHTRKEMVVTLDLRDCFPNINNKKIYSVWFSTLKLGRKNSALLTQLTSFQTRLPQGAPTSLALCNLALLPLFNEIKIFCEPNSISVTFYVDDITLSGKHDIVLKSMNKIIQIIQKHGYAIKNKKIRKMPASQKQKVNGVLVNKKISKEMEEIELIRTMIINTAHSNKIFLIKKEKESIMGKIQYIKQLSEKKGKKLEDFAQTLLEGIKIKEIKYNRRRDIRKCSSTKKHEYYL